jgi:hypothetical protein
MDDVASLQPPYAPYEIRIVLRETELDVVEGPVDRRLLGRTTMLLWTPVVDVHVMAPVGLPAASGRSLRQAAR